MYSPKDDVTHAYTYVETDFVKHLALTTLVVAVLAVLCSALFREPVRPALKIATVAQTQPILFESVSVNDLNGKGQIASYGPPYNNGTGSLQDPLQKFVGVIHPVNTAQDFVVKPLQMAAHLDPAVQKPLDQWEAASRSQQLRWADAYSAALAHARLTNGQITVAKGAYGPVPVMLNTLLKLGQSGLMTGALDRTGGDYTFNSMNSLLFLQGRPLQDAARRLELAGNQWGIIHEEDAPYPGPWWMTIVTAIYQIPYIANASAGDAVALGLGLVLFVLLMIAPWIPGVNRLPRFLGVHRLIWRDYYAQHRPSDPS